MIKSSVLTLLLLIYSHSALLSQKISIDWSEPLETNTSVASFISEKGDRIYTFSERKNNYYLECYNNNSFSQVFSTKLEVPRIQNKVQEIEKLIFLENQFTLFTSFYSKWDKTFHLNAYKINNSGAIDSKPVELIQIIVEDKNEIGKIDFDIANDSTHILVHHYHYDKKNSQHYLNLFILDAYLNIISSSKETFARKQDGVYTNLIDCRIANNQDIYFSLVKYTPLTAKSNLQLNCYILRYAPSGEKLGTYPVELDSTKRITSIHMCFDKKQQLLIYGTFDDQSTDSTFSGNSFTGMFIKRMNPLTGEIIAFSDKKFDAKEISTFYTEKQHKYGGTSMLPNRFYPKTIIEKQDGGIVLVYEDYYYRYYPGPNGMASEEYYYGDLIVVDFTADNQIDWMKIIPKRQSYLRKQGPLGAGFGPVMVSKNIYLNSDEAVYYSYLAINKDGKLFIIFNDISENLSVRLPKDAKMVSKIKYAEPVVIAIAEDGTMTKKILLEQNELTENEEINIRPKISFQVNNNRILIYGSKGGDEKIGVISIE